MGALRAGTWGAVALTAAHEGLRANWGKSPRMDRLGERALSKGLAALGLPVPKGQALRGAAFAGDLLSNAVYYALALGRSPRHRYLRGATAGALAGLGAVVLPPVLGLGRAPRARRRDTRFATVALYTLGGLVAAAAFTRRR